MKRIMNYVLAVIMVSALVMTGCAGSGKIQGAGCEPLVVKIAAPTATITPAPPVAVVADKKETIYFDFDKSNYIASEQAKIDKVVGWVKADPKSKAIIIGYADPIGTDPHNLALSKKRAEAVKTALVKAGIPADKISVEYKGETNLVVPGKKTIKDNAPNRRAEVTVTVK